jgi:hypothetical protein
MFKKLIVIIMLAVLFVPVLSFAGGPVPIDTDDHTFGGEEKRLWPIDGPLWRAFWDIIIKWFRNLPL